MEDTPPEMQRDLSRLISLFQRAEAEIARALVEALSAGAGFTAAYRRQRHASIREILTRLLALALSGNPEDPAGPAWDVVRSAYRTGSARAVTGARIDSGEEFGDTHLATAQTLFEALAGRLQDAVTYVGRRVDDAFRRATLEENLQGAIQGKTRRETSGAIEERLRGEGVKAFRDKAGREWGLANYAAMAARTTAREAHTLGTTMRLAENGLDLVQVSEHVQDERDVCTPHEGKIYSISGAHPTYPPATGNLPPYHPNCRHVVTPYVEEFN